MKKYILFLSTISFLLPSSLLAFPCVLSLVKGSCWVDYDVRIVVQDVKTEKDLVSVTAAKGKLWQRGEFTCQPGQILNYTATFKPGIGEGTENIVYKARNIWSLPSAVKPSEREWELRLCFPQEFARVPYPPKAGKECSCDQKILPALPLLP